MHLIIPFAITKECNKILTTSHLAKFANWLQQFKHRFLSDKLHLSLPADILLAKEQNLTHSDGLTPFAQQQAQQLGLTATTEHWAQINLCHWQVSTQKINLAPLEQLDISDYENTQLLQVLQQFFIPDQISLYTTPINGQWLANSQLFAQLPSCNPNHFMLEQPAPNLLAPINSPASMVLRRLQEETQMLLYRHPVNQQRIQNGLLAINGFVISNTGYSNNATPKTIQIVQQPQQSLDFTAQIILVNCLSYSWYQNNANSWLSNWQLIEQYLLPQFTKLAKANKSFTISLCNEQQYYSFSQQKLNWQQKLQSLFQPSKTNFVALCAPLLNQ